MPQTETQDAKKLVHVPRLGVVAFPWSMPDERIIGQIRAIVKQGTGNREQGTGANLATLRTHAKARFGGLTTEESEHRRQMGNVPEVTPDWNTVRQAVSKATEPTLPNANTTPANSSWAANRDAAWNAGVNAANVGGNVLKRAGRFLFGVVDMPAQVSGIVSRLFSPDEKVSQQAEGELLALHPGAQIADRLKEGIQDWRKSKSLAAENAVGDLLGFFLLSKAGKTLPEARIKQLEAEGVVLPPEAKPKAPAELPKTPPQAPTIEGQFQAAGPIQPVRVEPVEAAAKLTRNEPPKLPEAKAEAAELALQPKAKTLSEVKRPSFAEPDLSTAEVVFSANWSPDRLYRGTNGEDELQNILSSQAIASTSETASRLGKSGHQGMTFFSDHPNVATSYVHDGGYVIEVDASKVPETTRHGAGEIATTKPTPLSAITRVFKVGKDEKGYHAVDVTSRVLPAAEPETAQPVEESPLSTSASRLSDSVPEREAGNRNQPAFAKEGATNSQVETTPEQIARQLVGYLDQTEAQRRDAWASNRDIEVALQKAGLPGGKKSATVAAVKREIARIADERETAWQQRHINSLEYKAAEAELRKAYGEEEWASLPPEKQRHIVDADLQRLEEEEKQEKKKEEEHVAFGHRQDEKIAYMDRKQADIESLLTNMGANYEVTGGREGSTYSRYIRIALPEDESYEIRISDHEPPVGIRGGAIGGYNEATGDRYDAADISLHPGDDSIESLKQELGGYGLTEAKSSAEPSALFKLIYKPEPATQPEIADAWRNLGDVRLELEKNPPPKDPDVTHASPAEIEKWKADYKAWAEKSEPWLQKYRQAVQQIEDLNNKDIGQIRQLPDGKTVLYLNRDGLNGLYHAMHGGPRPEYTLSGVSLSPQDTDAVIRNLATLKPPLHQQLTEMIRRGMDKNGITISMTPEKGQSMREALATLREELNHGWQKNFADAAGNHLAAAQFKELNAAMPQPMANYIGRNYPEMPNDGSELTNRQRVFEASAKMLSEAPVTFGLTEDEAAAYLFQYFHAVEQAHGAKALDELVHITVLAKEIKNDYFNAGRPSGGSEKDAGGVRGIQEGRVPRAEGTAPPAQRGAPAGTGTGAGTAASLEPLKKQAATPQPLSAPAIESVKPEPVAPKSAGGAAVVPHTMPKEARSPAQIKSLLALRQEAERLRARSGLVVK